MRARWPYLALILAGGGCTGAIGANAGGTGSGAAGAGNPAGTGNSGGPGVAGAGNAVGTGTGNSGGPGHGRAPARRHRADAGQLRLRRDHEAARRHAAPADDDAVPEHGRRSRGWAVGGASAGQTVMTELASPLGELPDDRREAVPQDLHGSYRRLDQSLQQIHVESTYDVARGAGRGADDDRAPRHRRRRLRDRHQHLERRDLPGHVHQEVRRARAAPPARRPTRSTFYTMAYGSSTTASAAAYADLIGLFVTAPEFMYFVEHGDTAVAGQTGVYDVSPYELASRLSYQLWQTAPDDALLAAAADGSLRDADHLQRAGDAPARRSARAPGAGRVLRRLDEGRGPARDGREERRRRRSRRSRAPTCPTPSCARR